LFWRGSEEKRSENFLQRIASRGDLVNEEIDDLGIATSGANGLWCGATG
jgi:hypothetical protein